MGRILPVVLLWLCSDASNRNHLCLALLGVTQPCILVARCGTNTNCTARQEQKPSLSHSGMPSEQPFGAT
jgi:hypothetical protein